MSAVFLSGCSSQEEEDKDSTIPTENASPVIQFVGEKNIQMNEREQIVLSYNVADSDNSDSSLTVSYEVNGIEESNLDGNITLDTTSKTITYSVDDIQQDLGFSIVLNVQDPEGATATAESLSSRTATINVLNSINEKPELSFSFENPLVTHSVDKDGEVQINVDGAATSNEENEHVFNMQLMVTDSDNDDLTVNISNQNNLTGRYNEETNVLEITTPKTFLEPSIGSFSIVVEDGNEPLIQNFQITTQKTEVSPTLEVIKPQDSEGDAVFVVKESEDLIISYKVSDKNNDIVYVTSSDIQVGDITDESTDGTIVLSNLNINENTEGYIAPEGNKNGYVEIEVTLTATDRTTSEDVSETFIVVVEDDVAAEFNATLENIDLEISKYNSLSSRQDEMELFKFYSEYVLLSEEMTQEQIDSLKTQLENNRTSEEEAVEALIAKIQGERKKETPDSNSLEEMLLDLQELVSNFGVSGINILNAIAAESDGVLLEINADSPLNVASDESSYSRYVGNSEYGYYTSVFVWKFLSAYEVYELVNFQGECN
jgi:hypothetical protein